MEPYYEDVDNGILIYHGDARDIIPHLPQEQFVDMIFTDPPYGQGYRGQYGIHSPLANDDEGNLEILNEVFLRASHLLKSEGHVVATYAPGKPILRARWLLMLDKIFSVDSDVIWHKGLGMGSRYRRCYESIIIAHLGGIASRWFSDRSQRDLIQHPRKLPDRNGGHPTPKPVPLCEYFIGNHTLEEELVLDPFVGEGSTLVAAISTNRRAIGIEIEEKWCERAARRAEDARRSRR